MDIPYICITLVKKHGEMLYWLNRIWVWMRRSRHSRGFGVQSPWAYRFIRYVVNEHYPYYSYDDLKQEIPELSSRERKMCRLYFRLANYRQADEMWSLDDDDRLSCAIRGYVQRACKKTKITYTDRVQDFTTGRLEMLRITPAVDMEAAMEKAIAAADVQSMVIVENIYKSPQAHRIWQQCEEDIRCITTFDLYECGIIFFDTKRYKEKYIVNF